MSAKRRLGRVQRATALVPLALLSAAWTASLAGVGADVGAGTSPGTAPGASPSAEPGAPVTLPDGTSVPTQSIEAPASVSSPDRVAPGVAGAGGAVQVVSTASTASIPSAALAAYQRAETVINAADESCNLDWQLVAAIGRVESDHGRYGGNTLDDQGVASPGIIGIALDGSRNTQAISDTDAGQFDDDSTWDRAVGPMQFIPSTWSVVGVDADGDGERNPQDVDDAALATAVYLCSGGDDLSSDAGRRAAVHRYNHSQSYVDLVLDIRAAYTEGAYTSVPNGTTAADYLVPDRSLIPPSAKPQQPQQSPPQPQQPPSAGPRDVRSSTGGGPTVPPTPAVPAPPVPAPGGGGAGGAGGAGGNGIPSAPAVTLPTLPSSSATPVDQVLTKPQAIIQCASDFGTTMAEIIDSPDPKVGACVAKYTTR